VLKTARSRERGSSAGTFFAKTADVMYSLAALADSHASDAQWNARISAVLRQRSDHV